MNDSSNDFDTIEKLSADRRHQQDFDDLQAELGGYENGRTHHLLSTETRAAIKDGRDGKGKSRMSALEWAMLNADYAATFQAAENECREAQQVATQFQSKVDNALVEMKKKVDQTLDAAVTLPEPDGRKAFMDKNGEAWTLDGERVDDAIAEGIDWAGRPSLETYQDQQDRLFRLEDLANEGRASSLRLGEIDNTLHDDDHPPSKDDIQALRDETKALSDRYDEMGREVDAIQQPTSNITVAPVAGLDLSALPSI